MITAGLTCHAQSFELADDFGVLANGAEVYHSGPPDTLQLITWLHLSNISGNTINVLMKKEEISMVPGTTSSICWGGYCYGTGMMVSTFPLTMPPGETEYGCFGHYGPGGGRGESVVRWTFFNESDPMDSISVTAHYSTYPLANENIPDPSGVLSFTGKVPANDQIMVSYSLQPGRQGRIELRNLAGKIISVSRTISLSGTISLSVMSLPSGIYFCTLMVDGKPIVTRKVPVCH